VSQSQRKLHGRPKRHRLGAQPECRKVRYIEKKPKLGGGPKGRSLFTLKIRAKKATRKQVTTGEEESRELMGASTYLKRKEEKQKGEKKKSRGSGTTKHLGSGQTNTNMGTGIRAGREGRRTKKDQRNNGR